MLPATLPDLRLHVSAFDNAFDPRPKALETTVAGLIRALTTFQVIAVANKLDLPAWSPARFAGKGRRKAENVASVCAVVLDYDAGDPEAALAAWAGFVAVLHSTWSHSVEAPRFRVVVPLATSIPASRWADAWALATARAPGADPACKDPSRLYFRPALRDLDAPHFARVQGGELFDLLTILPPPNEPAPVRAQPSTVVVPFRLRDRAIGVRLDRDPGSRERIAAELGAVLTGEGGDRRAAHAVCPNCGDASAWFYLSPNRLRRARCNHRNSCGWTGTLDELLGRGAA